MQAAAEWQWDEFQQVGTDYARLEEVEAYDARMASARDVATENREDLDALALPKGAAVLDIGCGTGRFARAALARGLKAAAADISPMMLEYLRKKAADEGLPEPETQHAGFLTMQFPDASFDGAASTLALHHLPDIWKLVALKRVAKALKPGGQLILRDVVFSLQGQEEPDACFSRFVSSLGDLIRPGAVRHVKQEFSTFDWIMEGLLERGGFRILSKRSPSEGIVVYHARKA